MRKIRSFRNSKTVLTESQVRFAQQTVTRTSVGFEVKKYPQNDLSV